MALRRFLFAAAVFTTLSTTLPHCVRAEDAPDAQDVEKAKHNFVGVINSPDVTVLSAAREDAYPVMQLQKGTQVTIVGLKTKWLKIVPPDGSFAYVPKAYVNQRGDGKLGRATHESIAKVGSNLSQLKTASWIKVDEGQDVEIMGDQDEYWKIKPPAGACLYVNQNYVDPVKALPSLAEAKSAASTPLPPAASGPNENTPKTGGPLVTATPTPGTPTPAPPAVDPAKPSAELTSAFEKLEADFKAGNEKPITDQPIDTLLAGYSDFLKQDALTPPMRKISEVRVSTLKLRQEAKAEYLAASEAQAQAAQRQQSLTAERDEIKDRMKAKEVAMYTAVGTLRASSVQRGAGTFYRLTDPSTGRTVVYVQSADAKFAGLLGQFIGVKGNISVDTALNMKIINNPSEPAAVDATKLGSSIAAQIMPASLMMHASTGSPTD